MPAEIIAVCVICALIGAFLTYIIVNALIATRKRETKDLPRVKVDDEKKEKYRTILSEMVSCRTVYDKENTNKEEYARFYKIIEENFPLLTKNAVRHDFDGCFLYEIRGGSDKNLLLMSHHDVVGEEGEWETPAFEPTLKDGAIYARGTIDTKTPLFAELQAVEELLEEGYEFPINLFIASSNNEEIAGDGMPKCHAYFLERGLRFDLVLDEGGAIVQKMMPGVKEKSAMVAVHEKGRHYYTCIAKKLETGHVGLNPVKDNAVERLSAFMTEVKNSNIFKKKFTPEVEGLFRTHAPYMPFVLRLVMSNFGLFKGLLLKILGKVSPVVDAMLSTSLYFKDISGDANECKTTAFFRCLREEDLMLELEEIKKIAQKYSVEIVEKERDYCIPSSADTPQFARLKGVMNKLFPDVIVSPFLLTAGTDARHLGDVADCILRFAPIDLNPAQYASIHSVNEHIYLANVCECVGFYKGIVKSYH